MPCRLIRERERRRSDVASETARHHTTEINDTQSKTRREAQRSGNTREWRVWARCHTTIRALDPGPCSWQRA